MNASDDKSGATSGSVLSSKNDLLDRILAHQFDDPDVELPFSVRLAHENGWTEEFALRVVDEYRRFVYLACTGREEVTPSDEVDQAWHLHLAYSRDYWLKFCPDVLQQDLHHGPTAGGEVENDRYKANYLRTLNLYNEEFGEKPPIDIWPPAQIRFEYAAGNVRVNRKLFRISPNPVSPRDRPIFHGVSVISTVIMVAIPTVILFAVGSWHPFLIMALAFIAIYLWPHLNRFVISQLMPRNQTLRQQLHEYDVVYHIRPASDGNFATGKVIDVSVVIHSLKETGAGHRSGGGGFIGTDGCGSGCGSGCGGGGGGGG